MGVLEEKINYFYPIDQRELPFVDDICGDVLKEEFTSNLLTQCKYSELEVIEELQRKNLFIAAKNFINTMPKDVSSLEEVEFQVYSQFGEDGIIQWLIKNVNVPNRTFVEFVVEDYSEANTRFLLMNNNWSGVVIDGSKENIDRLKKWKWFWKYDLTAADQFITKDNINEIIANAGFAGDIGILSVDIGRNDYWVLNAIECVKSRILICEYNNILGGE